MDTTGTDTTERILHIRFKRTHTVAIERALEPLDRCESPAPYFEVTFHDPDQLHRVTRPANLELLRTIAREQASI